MLILMGSMYLADTQVGRGPPCDRQLMIVVGLLFSLPETAERVKTESQGTSGKHESERNGRQMPMEDIMPTTKERGKYYFFTERRKIIVFLYVCPGFRTTEGNFG